MLLLFHLKKIHVFNFRCLTKQQNFITHETFANYGMTCCKHFI